MKPELTINRHGVKIWYKNNQDHRKNGPAVELSNGDKEWFKNGQRHREGGPAIEWSDGSKFWFNDGERHREDGPAVEKANGDKMWKINDKFHREDGPAVEYADGYRQWFINDIEIFPEENLIEIPETEDEMLQVFNQYKFVQVGDEYYFINQYIKEFKKEWYEKYRLLFK